MILTKLYEEFLKNTNLTDSTYKTTFVRIQDIFDYLNQISFKTFKYTLNDDSFIYDFEESSSKVPSYVIETMKNMFDKFFSFPVGTSITLEVYYNNLVYRVVHEDGRIIIPPQLEFMEKYKLFPFFIATLQEKDAYDTFEYLFRFLYIKEAQKNSFTPLRNLFERKDAIQEIDDGEISEKSISSYSLVIEDLQYNKEKIIKQIEKNKKKREELRDLKNNLIQFAHFKDKYELEYNSLTDDFKYLKEQKNSYLKKYQEILELIKEIDGHLSDINAAEEKDNTQLKYYLDQKKFLQDKGAMFTNTIKELGDMQETTKFRLEELDVTFQKYKSFNLQDLDKLSKDLEKLEIKEEKLHMSLIEIDGNIKHAKEAQNDTAIKLEKSSYADHVVNSSMIQAIPDFLAKPDFPQSVTIVRNYLKQYFVYLCEKAIQELDIKELTTSIIFNILRDSFGFNPLILFSAEELKGFSNIIEIEN